MGVKQLWLMTIAVFASNGPIHLSSRKDDIIRMTASPVAYCSLKLGLLVVTLAFSVGVNSPIPDCSSCEHLTNRCSQRPHFEIHPACLPRHPAVAYLFLVRPHELSIGRGACSDDQSSSGRRSEQDRSLFYRSSTSSRVWNGESTSA